MSWYENGRWDRDAIESFVVGVRMPWSVWGPEGPLEPPASPDLVGSFEDLQGVTLPPEYRSFVLQVTAGSLLWLPAFDRSDVESGFGPWAMFDRRSDLYHRPFDVADRSEDSIDGEAQASGTWLLSDSGDAMGELLVIAGPASGEVWTFDNGTVSPCLDQAGRRHRFNTWFQFEVERTVAASVRD